MPVDRKQIIHVPKKNKKLTIHEWAKENNTPEQIKYAQIRFWVEETQIGFVPGKYRKGILIPRNKLRKTPGQTIPNHFTGQWIRFRDIDVSSKPQTPKEQFLTYWELVTDPVEIGEIEKALQG